MLRIESINNLNDIEHEAPTALFHRQFNVFQQINTKPFEPEEVIARIQAALRRTATSKKLSCLNLELYPDSRKVTVHGIELSLTAHEYDLLYLFIKNPEKVYSREMLYDLVWHGDQL